MQNPTPNVVIFGEAGVGKSSVVNLILGDDKAPVSADAKAYNDSNVLYEVTIDGKKYNLYDIDEGSADTLGCDDAIANLYELVCSLYKTGGVNLLVFVVKCGRLSKSGQKNYALFHDAFCKRKVPIVIIVTGCENVEPMDSWWDQNQSRFKRAKMTFRGHACVCAYRGRKITKEILSDDHPHESRGKVGIPQEFYSNDGLFRDSKREVRKLIESCCPPTGWRKKSSNAWFQKLLKASAKKVKLKKKMPDAYKLLHDRFLRSSSPEKILQHIEAIQTRKVP